jgi:formate hydrogenlyase subunit 3/multisubunit Na+/H+ antiporter MnhD subunit
MIEAIVRAGLLAGLGGSMLAALTGLGARKRAARSASHLLLGIGAAAGTAGAATFLATGLCALTVADSPLFFGAPLAVDRLSAFFLLLLHTVTLYTSLFASRYCDSEHHKYPPLAVLPLTAAFVLGMQGVLLWTGLGAFLLCWELMSIASFFLVMADGGDESRAAALLYLAIAQFGAGALLVGMALLTGGNLVATFGTLAASASTLSPGQRTLALLLVLFAFSSKAGLVPLHAWLPEAHPRAPSHVSALMSGVMLKVAVYGILRFTSICWPDLAGGWGIAMIALGLGGAAKAVIHANLDRDVKRVLAWSSVENIGLIFAMFGFSVLLRSRGMDGLAGTVEGAMFLHIFAHGLFKSGLFLGAGATMVSARTLKLESLGGLANRTVRLSAGMLALSLAAAALPPFGTFAAEWLLLQAVIGSLEAGDPQVLAVGVAVLAVFGLIAGLAVFAMLRLFAFMFLAEPRSDGARLASEPASALGVPVLASAVLVLLLGVLSPWASPMLPSKMDLAAWNLEVLTPIAWLALALVAATAAVWLLQRVLGRRGGVRRYHTWDCGQPIDATMEYTATAFSAPVRHFLRDIVRAEKHVVFRSVVSGNPWIRTGEMELRRSAGMLERVYYPIAQIIDGVGARLKGLQNGVVQFYIGLILATLLLALWISL